MIEITNTSVMNFENAIRGARNPMNSWDRMDSEYYNAPIGARGRKVHIPEAVRRGIPEDDIKRWKQMEQGNLYILGKNDLSLAQRLCGAGSDHRKFLRQILVSVDIKAPLYFFKEFDQYKVATVTNSTSTMHTVHKKEFTLDDFSHDHIATLHRDSYCYNFEDSLISTIYYLNIAREMYLETKNKDYWWQMIQLLPTSYNQLRTCTLNYEVLRNIYHARCHHKLDEWHAVCDWIASLPYAKELIIDIKEKDNA